MRRCGFFAAFVVGCVIVAIGACVINYAAKTVESINERQHEKVELMADLLD